MAVASTVVTGCQVTLTTQPSPTAAVGLVVAWPALLAATGGYAVGTAVSPGRSPRPALRAGAALGLLCWVLTALLAVVDQDRALIATTAGVTAACSLSRLLSARRTARTAAPIRVVLVGSAAAVDRALGDLAEPRCGRWQVVAACIHGADDPELDIPLACGLETLPEVVDDVAADIVLALPGATVDQRDLQRLAGRVEATRAELCVATGLQDVALDRVSLVPAGALRVLHVRPAQRPGPGLLAKTVAERVLATFGLVLLTPLLLVLVAAVRWDSEGPAVFRQTRVGRAGGHFTVFKLRTMTVDAEERRADLVDRNEVDSVLFKMREDPRVTRVGSWLRRYSLDELPQLLNIARGEMSLVGPRPALPEEVALYDDDPRRRLLVKPGLTGLWQVSGRSDLSWEDSVRLDVSYVDNWSLRLDLSILLRTVGAVLSRRGAY